MSMTYLWSCSVLLILKLLESLNVQNGLIIWFLGIPFVTLVACSFSNKTLSKLIENSLKFNSPEEVIEHATMILLMIKDSGRDIV